MIMVLFLKQERTKLEKRNTTTMAKVVAMPSNVGQGG
jgi:hypothetical protein